MNPATHQRICAEIQERHQREMAAVVGQRDELAAALEKLARLGNEPHYGNQIARDALAKVGGGETAEPDCDRSACGDFSPGRCDNPECPALRHNVEVTGLARLFAQVRWNDGLAGNVTTEKGSNHDSESDDMR